MDTHHAPPRNLPHRSSRKGLTTLASALTQPHLAPRYRAPARRPVDCPVRVMRVLFVSPCVPVPAKLPTVKECSLGRLE